jgi:hypothetical protein
MKRYLFVIFVFILLCVSCKLESEFISTEGAKEEAKKEDVIEIIYNNNSYLRTNISSKIIVFSYKDHEYILFYDGNNSCMIPVTPPYIIKGKL